MDVSFVDENLSVIEHWMRGGEILPAQQPSRSDFTAERKLALAVLMSAIGDLRNGESERVREDAWLWIQSDESEWPYSFLRLCELFGLDPSWVRMRARRWWEQERVPRRRVAISRFAA